MSDSKAGGNERPFQNTRTQKQWNFECVESAVFELLPSSPPTMVDPVTVTWQEVCHKAAGFDGFTGDGKLVRELLSENQLDTIDSKEVAEGYVVQRSQATGNEQ